MKRLFQILGIIGMVAVVSTGIAFASKAKSANVTGKLVVKGDPQGQIYVSNSQYSGYGTSITLPTMELNKDVRNKTWSFYVRTDAANPIEDGMMKIVMNTDGNQAVYDNVYVTITTLDGTLPLAGVIFPKGTLRDLMMTQTQGGLTNFMIYNRPENASQLNFIFERKADVPESVNGNITFNVEVYDLQ